VCLIRVSHTIFILMLLRERSVSHTCVSHDLHSNAAEREECVYLHSNAAEREKILMLLRERRF
jgi:hypothetical protein